MLRECSYGCSQPHTQTCGVGVHKAIGQYLDVGGWYTVSEVYSQRSILPGKSVGYDTYRLWHSHQCVECMGET